MCLSVNPEGGEKLEPNSSIERLFRNLKKFVKACSLQRIELKSELNNFHRL